MDDFQPRFYWTGKIEKDALRINQPHIQSEGVKEERIKETIELLVKLEGQTSFTLADLLNIQNHFLKTNNWKGIVPGIRTHEVQIQKGTELKEVCPPEKITERLIKILPVEISPTYPRVALLKWYRQFQMIHPFADLNGRVGGVIVSVLYSNILKQKKK